MDQVAVAGGQSVGGVAGTVFGVLPVAAVTVAFFATRWRRPRTTLESLEEWGVGGRVFGN